MMIKTATPVKGLPVLGNFLQISKDNFELIHHVATQTGRVANVKVFSKSIYVVWHPDDIQHILRDNSRNYPKDITVDNLEAISGSALTNMDGDEWLVRRRQLQPYFHRKQIMSMLDLMQTALDERLTIFAQMLTEDSDIDMTIYLRELTARIFTRGFFGVALSDDAINRLSSAIMFALVYTTNRLMSFSFVPEWAPFPGKSRYEADRAFLHQQAHDLIHERRNDADGGDDLLSMMIDMVDDTDSAFDEQALVQEVVALFQGGFETASGTLGWIFYVMALYPQIQEKLHAELDAVLVDGKRACDVTEQLTYTHQVIQEVMRLYPVAATVARYTQNDDDMNGYHIPAETIILISLYKVQRHPDFWDDPEVFRPERFAEGEKPAGHTFAYVPFGSGSRRCIGEHFALYEMRLTVAEFFKRYRVRLKPDYQLEVSSWATYFPSNLSLIIEKRD